jgi:hypothetical protein
MLFLLLLTVVLGTRESQCSGYTTQFFAEQEEYSHSFFYYPQSISEYDERCHPTNKQGLGEEYYTSKGDDVEYIINLDDFPELYGCDKNIRGNLIIVRSIWNNELKQLCPMDAEIEKGMVYGDLIIGDAYNAIKECCSLSLIQ